MALILNRFSNSQKATSWQDHPMIIHIDFLKADF